MSPSILAFWARCSPFWRRRWAPPRFSFFQKISRTACSGPSWALPRGVMIAASVWSLAGSRYGNGRKCGAPAWLPAAGGFVLGAVFLLALDRLLPHLHPGSDEPEGLKSSFAARPCWCWPSRCTTCRKDLPWAWHSGWPATAAPCLLRRVGAFSGHGAAKLSPEGAAISCPEKEGLEQHAQFCLRGAQRYCRAHRGRIGRAGGENDHRRDAVASGLCGRRDDLRGGWEELIPEASSENHSHTGTLSVMLGFLVMMVLDVALG